MRTLAFTLILLFGAGASAAPVPKELKQRPDAERILGLWIYDSIDTGNGQAASAGRWIFKPNKLYAGGTNTTDNQGVEYGIILRSELAPTQLDITQGGRVICTGICKFEGEELHISYVHNGERPKDYASAPGRTVLKLKRGPEAAK